MMMSEKRFIRNNSSLGHWMDAEHCNAGYVGMSKAILQAAAAAATDVLR
jgi:hypothetical protein